MLNDLGILSRQYSSKDAQTAKSIIDILFVFINDNVKKDRKMNSFTKSIILGQLPGISMGSKDYIDEMNVLSIKKLLDDIESQLKNRK